MTFVHILEGFSMARNSTVVRSLYGYDAEAVSRETGLVCPDVSRARQSEAEEADINTIVRNFGITGRMPSGVRAPVYGDFDLVSDYQSALEAVRAADAAFLAMPADVRRRFGDDPQAFVEFCSDEANREEAIKLGLIVPPEVPITPEVSSS